MPENWNARLTRWAFNLFPAYRGSGGRVTYIAADWSEVRIKLPLNWRTRNYVGTLFGGSIYGAVDPFYMIQLIKRLGPDYVVWDKSASVRFLKPGRSTLFAQFLMPEDELAAIRQALESQKSVDRTYSVELKDSEGVVCAQVEKVVYVRKKNSDQAAGATAAGRRSWR
jgi:acyl-coenzyme A thioesterase PaaI-like protein